MVNFVALAATAKRLVEANGRDVTLFRKDRSPANAAEPWRGPDLSTPDPAAGIGPVKMAFVPPSGSGFGKMLFDFDETLRVKLDQIGLLAAKSVTDLGNTIAQVEEADTLVDGTRAWKIVTVMNLTPADTPMLFAIGLKS